MSDLTFIEKRKLEQLFGMGSGYVYHFSNRTFDDFFIDTIGLNIWDEKYNYGSGSKANRMREFWEKEPNHIVGRLLIGLLEYMSPLSDETIRSLYEECWGIAQRLLSSAPVPEISIVDSVATGREFEALAKSVKDAIENNEPQTGLDRLHTFTMKFVRTLCEKHEIGVTREKALHSLFGEYVKCLKSKGVIHSRMTEHILKTSISVLEAFNDVRNDQSLAHDNKMLGYNESLLIFNHVTSAIRFLKSLEEEMNLSANEKTAANSDDDMPF